MGLVRVNGHEWRRKGQAVWGGPAPRLRVGRWGSPSGPAPPSPSSPRGLRGSRSSHGQRERSHRSPLRPAPAAHLRRLVVFLFLLLKKQQHLGTEGTRQRRGQGTEGAAAPGSGRTETPWCLGEPTWGELLHQVPGIHGRGWTGSTTTATKNDTCHSKWHQGSDTGHGTQGHVARGRARQGLQRKSSPRSIRAPLCRSPGQGEVGRAGVGVALQGCPSRGARGQLGCCSPEDTGQGIPGQLLTPPPAQPSPGQGAAGLGSYFVSSVTSTSVGAVMGAFECPAVGSSVFSSPLVELITWGEMSVSRGSPGVCSPSPPPQGTGATQEDHPALPRSTEVPLVAGWCPCPDSGVQPQC